PDKPALKPYWGKPTVRNFRGDDGNGGIIRSPQRAIVLPDRNAPSSYPTATRHRPTRPVRASILPDHLLYRLRGGVAGRRAARAPKSAKNHTVGVLRPGQATTEI